MPLLNSQGPQLISAFSLPFTIFFVLYNVQDVSTPSCWESPYIIFESLTTSLYVRHATTLWWLNRHIHRLLVTPWLILQLLPTRPLQTDCLPAPGTQLFREIIILNPILYFPLCYIQNFQIIPRNVNSAQGHASVYQRTSDWSILAFCEKLVFLLRHELISPHQKWKEE